MAKNSTGQVIVQVWKVYRPLPPFLPVDISKMHGTNSFQCVVSTSNFSEKCQANRMINCPHQSRILFFHREKKRLFSKSCCRSLKKDGTGTDTGFLIWNLDNSVMQLQEIPPTILYGTLSPMKLSPLSSL